MVKKGADSLLPGQGLASQHTGSQSTHTISYVTCYIISTWPLGDMGGRVFGDTGQKHYSGEEVPLEILSSECVIQLHMNQLWFCMISKRNEQIR